MIAATLAPVSSCVLRGSTRRSSPPPTGTSSIAAKLSLPVASTPAPVCTVLLSLAVLLVVVSPVGLAYEPPDEPELVTSGPQPATSEITTRPRRTEDMLPPGTGPHKAAYGPTTTPVRS